MLPNINPRIADLPPRRDAPPHHVKPQRDRDHSKSQQNVKENLSHNIKRQVQCGRQQERHVHRVIKSLLIILGRARLVGIKHAPVKALLNLARNFDRVRVTMVQQQLSCAHPAWIEIGMDTAQRAVRCRISDLLRNDYSIRIKPGSRGTKRRCDHPEQLSFENRARSHTQAGSTTGARVASSRTYIHRTKKPNQKNCPATEFR